MRKNYKLTIFCCFGGCLVQAMVINYLPLLFVVPIVGLVSNFNLIAQNFLPILITIAVPAVITFAVSGLVTQKLLKKEVGHDEK